MQTTAPIDGGWGWVVAISICFSNFLNFGHFKAFGVYVIPLMNLYKAKPSEVAWVTSIPFGLFAFIGPLTMALTRVFGVRRVAFVGGCVCGAGFAISSLANNLVVLGATFGICGAIGASFTFNPALQMLGDYFLKRRGFANGICMAGNALGGIFMPIIIELLISIYGFRGAILIVGGMLLNSSALSMLWQPVQWHSKPITTSSTPRHSDADAIVCPSAESPAAGQLTEHKVREKRSGSIQSIFENGVYDVDGGIVALGSITSIPSAILNQTATSAVSNSGTDNKAYEKDYEVIRYAKHPLTIHHRDSLQVNKLRGPRNILKKSSATKPSEIQAKTKKTVHIFDESSSTVSATIPEQPLNLDCKYGESNNDAKPRSLLREKLGSTLDLSAMRNPIFWAISGSQMFAMIGYPGTQLFLPLRAIQIGCTDTESATILSALAAADLVGRLMFSWLSDLNMFPRNYWYTGGMLLTGVMALCIPHCTTYSTLVSVSALFGFFAGAFMGLIASRISDVFGGERVGMVYGLLNICCGICGLAGAPLLGYVMEMTSNYIITQTVAGITLIIGGLISLQEPVIVYCKRNKSEIETSKL